ATLSLSTSAVSVNEDVQSGNVVINVLRGGDTTGTVTVAVAAAGGDATAGTDYTLMTSSPLSFGPGVTTLPVTINIANRANFQGDRFFNLTLSNPSAGSTLLFPTSAKVTILETAPPPAGVISFTSATYTDVPTVGGN